MVFKQLYNFVCKFIPIKMSHSLDPPNVVRGMKKLNRDLFTHNVLVPSFLVPNKNVRAFTKCVKPHIVSLLGVKSVIKPPEQYIEANDVDKYKLVFLQPGTEVDKDVLEKFSVLNKPIDHKLKLGYENYKQAEIFRSVLPDDGPGVTGFTQIGHIIHVNLRDHALPYKHLIGEVFLDKIGTAKSVVHKPNVIQNKFRNFEFELLAGEDNFVTSVIEYGLKFTFDFSKVFWNSRLSTEHRRLLEFIDVENTVFDVFAGVGPFAIPLAKKGCAVYANDLNPDSFKWLQQNSVNNKVELNAFNLDGREFLEKQLKLFLLKNVSRPTKIHVVMNLPAIAVEFLDSLPGLLSRFAESESEQKFLIPTCEDLKDTKIIVHCYTFSPEENADDSIKTRVEKHLGYIPETIDIYFVRSVAPNKLMYCVTFTLSNNILVKSKEFSQNLQSSEEPEPKRLKQEQN